jgi:proline iminopeptidase
MKSSLRTFYPAVEPYDSGFLDVGQGHEVYWEVCGNPKGRPVLFLHGGPGSGCSANHRRLFNPKKYRIILFDQRGCGRSLPYACLKHNTTWHLVADMELLRQFLKIDAWLVVGGSWGSTLALAYSQTHARHVSGLILRGCCARRQSR